MKLNYTFNTLVWQNKAKIKNGQAPIYIRITIDGKRTEISTRKSIAPEKWNPDSQSVKGNNEEARIINQQIRLLLGEIENIHLQLSLENFIPTPDIIKQKLVGKENLPEQKTILQAFEYHNLKMAEMVEIGKTSLKTLVRYQISKKKIESFISHAYKLKDKSLVDIKLSFATDFEHYLLTHDRIHRNTAHKYIKILKKILNMSIGLDWIQVNPLNQFKCLYTNPEIQILNQDELNTIMNKKISIPRLEEVRDVFVFCCYTGFAYADVLDFENNAVTVGLDGEYWLKKNRQKTGTKESVPLLPIPLRIINKYKDHPYCLKYNKLLPVNSNQRYNGYLKEIADICHINKRITTHIARHTFATTITLANGVPIESVSSMLGHTSIRTTQIYAKVVEQKVSDEMKLLREKLNKTPKIVKLTS